MKMIKRAHISVSRNLSKTIVLFILILVLSAITMGALVAGNAVGKTSDFLSFGQPTVVTIGIDENAFFEIYSEEDIDVFLSHWSAINSQAVQELAQLRYVHNFDYSTVWNGKASLVEYVPESIDGHQSYMESQNGHMFFHVNGVSRPDIISIEDGIFELIEGRTFVEAEMRPNEINDAPIPILISNGVADVNNLAIGSVFNMYQDRFILPEDAIIPDGGLPGLELEEIWEHPYNNWVTEMVREFEVIGIFSIDYQPAINLSEFHLQIVVYNTFLAPNWVLEHLNFESFYSSQTWDSIFNADEHFGRERYLEELAFVAPFFVLEDATYIEFFNEEIQQLLSEFHVAIDWTETFAPLESAMDSLEWVSQRIVIFTLGATLIVLSLLITLFLHDRRQELGIYLALGEKKLKVLSQVMIEVIIVSLLAITLAVFIGYAVSTQVSDSILRSEIASANEESSHTIPSEMEFHGLVRTLTTDELVEFFDLSLNGQTIAIFYAIGLGTLVVSTVVPIIYVLELKPKEILMQSNIG
ncbi:MAG: FtsX-like permease family protein [Turicibacter sp.]|nr:FtsX-like permease family protein [Turicibacter sp.]